MATCYDRFPGKRVLSATASVTAVPDAQIIVSYIMAGNHSLLFSWLKRWKIDAWRRLLLSYLPLADWLRSTRSVLGLYSLPAHVVYWIQMKQQRQPLLSENSLAGATQMPTLTSGILRVSG